MTHCVNTRNLIRDLIMCRNTHVCLTLYAPRKSVQSFVQKMPCLMQSLFIFHAE